MGRVVLSLALSLVLLAAPRSGALTLGPPEGGPADDGRPQLARSRPGQQDDQELGSDGGSGVEDNPFCDPDARSELALKLRTKYRREWASVVQDAFETVDRAAYLTIGEVRHRKLLRNWLAHARNLSDDGAAMTIVNVQLDRNGTIECERSRERFQSDRLDIRCVSLGGWLPPDFFGKRVHSGPGTCVYNMIIWSKPEIFLTALKASKYDVMMVDTDVVLYKDLWKLGRRVLARNSNYELVVAHENHGWRNPNTGVVLATKRGFELLEWWAEANLEFVNSAAGDQSAFQALAKTTADFWQLTGIFKPTEIGQCGNRGIWATHYNCLGGQKESVMISRSDFREEARFGRHRNSSVRKIANSDYYADIAESLKANGDWWIEE